MTDSVHAVAPEALRAGAVTPGVTREIALEIGPATVMRARAEGGACSGWHHHGSRDVLGYVVAGQARFEFGPAGSDSVDVEAGGFFHVPAGLVHRDVNPLESPQEIVMTVIGSGPLVINVEGPTPDTTFTSHEGGPSDSATRSPWTGRSPDRGG